MSELTYVYGEITKADTTADGDLMVIGKAAGPELDLDGQRMDPGWLSKAMPKWMELGNVRAQHSPVAAGIGMELTEGAGSSWTLKALVVDADSKNKVLKKVYKGFSMGIKGARVVKHASAPNGLIVGGEIVEVSLVDRPANPTAMMTVCKSAGGSILLPVDDRGNEMQPGEITGKWLSADVHKMAVATADDVLGGNFDLSDVDGTAETLQELGDLLVAEGMALKAADLHNEPYSIDTLLKAAQAIEFISDADMSDYPGGGAGMQRDMNEYLNKMAGADGETAVSLIVADKVKAAVAEATGPLLERIEALSGQLAEVKTRPVPGGPVLITRPVNPELTKSSQADRLISQAQRPDVDPELARIMKQRAAQSA